MGRMHGLAPVIEDDVALRADVSGLQVANEADQLGMHWGTSIKLSSTRSRPPAWQFASFRS